MDALTEGCVPLLVKNTNYSLYASLHLIITYPSPNSNFIQFLSFLLGFVNFKHDLLSISLIASFIKAELLPANEMKCLSDTYLCTKENKTAFKQLNLIRNTLGND